MTRARPYDRDTALDAAMTLFWRQGYHATSLKDLEAALAMKPGSIYAAFQSKEALYLAALERYFERSAARLAELRAREGAPLPALAAFLRDFARPPADRPSHVCMVVKTMLDATDREATLGEAARAYLDRITAAVAACFEEARQAGDLPPDADPARLARRFQMAVTALRIEAQRSGADAELAELAEEMAAEITGLTPA